MPSVDDLRFLALHEPSESVLTIYARTDARDPANTNHVPGWLIALRNGLRVLEDSSVPRPLTELFERVRSQAEALPPAERGRSFAWFVTPDGSLDRRFTLQTPLRRDLVVLDERPFISPLVEVVDRGRTAAVVLVGADAVRLLEWEQGRISEPEDSSWEMSLGDWRDYRGPAGSDPGRGQHTATHSEHFEARVENRQRRFLDGVAGSLARRFDAGGLDRVVVAGEVRMARAFADRLEASGGDRVVEVLDANVDDSVPADLAALVEPVLEDHWRREASAAATAITETARAGGAAVLGAADTLAGLVQGRVERLLLDPDREYSLNGLGPEARHALDDRDARLAEVAVELAIASGAQVTAVDPSWPGVTEAGGMLARLRY